ncbi:LPS assembly protein LptD [Ferrovibrio terrae]|uniref:LPS-assembly protein LptD n=1 Tax=Ferrovibrio terrae TaxID=2594003 RepID=UPI003137D681
MSARRSGLLHAAILALLLSYSAQTQAQTNEATATGTNAPVLLTADRLNYNQSLGIVTAEGKVELSQGSRTLLADMVSYNERDDKVTASGNVSLMESNGNVLFAEYMELTGGMRNGFIRDVSFLLSDMSRGAAVQAERKDGNRTIMKKAVYTSCSLCESDPTRAPLWQVKGREVEHNEAEQNIKYRDAVFEMFGIPILYSPYFSHPDPTVNRRSGFLPPRYTNNPFFQQAIQAPYFYVIDDYSDLTVTPQYSTRQGPFLATDYRQRTARGEFQIDGSVADEDVSGDVRGHIRANAAFRATDDITYGANILRSTDDTYLSRYAIQDRPSGNTLVSRIYGEAINNRHFASLNAFSFQNQLARVRNSTVPVAVPVMDYSAVFEPGDYGGRWGLDANMVSLMRDQGTDMRRLSSTVSWSQPYYSPSGEVITATALVRADGYWSDDVNQSLVPGATGDSAAAGRVLPVVALDWRYPMIRDEGRMRQLIEPIIMGVVSPYGGNRSDIPNEDSVSFEFDETNLFSLSRFPGYDRWDGGPKLNYGMRMAAYGESAGYVEFLAGQSLRAKTDDTFTAASGLGDQFSDYVGRLTVSPGRYIQLVDRVRLAQNSGFEVRRHELGTTLGSTANNISISYADLTSTDFLRQTGQQEAIAATMRLQLTKYWATEIRHTRDLKDDGSLLNFGGLRYTDECFDIILFAERTFTINRDIQPSTTVGVRFRIASFN